MIYIDAHTERVMQKKNKYFICISITKLNVFELYLFFSGIRHMPMLTFAFATHTHTHLVVA